MILKEWFYIQNFAVEIRWHNINKINKQTINKSSKLHQYIFFLRFLYIYIYIYIYIYMIKISRKLDKLDTYKGFSSNISFFIKRFLQTRKIFTLKKFLNKE